MADREAPEEGMADREAPGGALMDHHAFLLRWGTSEEIRQRIAGRAGHGRMVGVEGR